MSTPPAAPYGWGGWAKTAWFLSHATGRDISRNYIYTTWRRRDQNGFPERQRIHYGGDLFDYAFRLEDVLLWYIDHHPSWGER